MQRKEEARRATQEERESLLRGAEDLARRRREAGEEAALARAAQEQHRAAERAAEKASEAQMRAQKRSILELRTVRRARLIALITASFHHNRCEARDEVELCEKAVPAARTFEEEIWKAVDRRILAPSRLAASAAALRVGVYEPSALQSALAEHGKALNKVLERLISQLPAAKEGARGLNVPNLLMHIRRQLTLAAPTRPDGTLQEGAARSCEALMTLPGFSERAVEAYTECFTSGWLPPALFAQLLTHHLHESVPALLRQPSHRLEWCLLGVQQVARALQGAK